ncbi:MAG: BamA/TamA family outer membrane protein [Acidobacteria bacterium]|nr:BamA/TamA family outer membrane protein [Acidobacteriota bacterium]
MRRRVAIGVLIASIAVLIGVVFFTPLSGKLLLGPALSFVESRYDLTGTASRLHLDVARLRIGLEDLRLAARGQSAEPFLFVEEATVDLPWAAVWGGVSIDDLTLRGVALSVVRGSDGRSNLPAARGGEGAPVGAAEANGRAIAGDVPIRRLAVSGLTIDWRDEVANSTLRLPPTSVRLAEAGPGGYSRGPVSMDGTAQVSWRGALTEISRLDGEIGFDGSDLTIHRLDVAAPEGELTLSGRIEGLIGSPSPVLEYEASLDLAQLADWLSGAAASGDLAVTGEAAATPGGVTASAVLSAETVGWGGAEVDRVNARVRLTPAAIDVNTVRIEVAGGVLAADGRVAREAGWPGRLEATWSGLDTDRLIAALSVPAPVTFAAAAEGSASVRWTELDPVSVTLSGENHLVPGSGPGGGLRLEMAGGGWRLTLDEFLGGARVAGELEGEVASEAATAGRGWVDAPIAGTLAVACDDLARCSRFVSTVDLLEGLPAVQGNATTDVEIGGSLGSPVVSAELKAPSLSVGEVVVSDLTAGIVVNRKHLAVSGARLSLEENEVTGDATLRWADGAIDGSFVAVVSDLAALAPDAALAWTPSARGRIELTAGGTRERLEADASFTFEAVEIAGRRLGEVLGEARLDAAESVRIVARIPELAATIEASLDLTGGERVFAVRGNATGTDLARLTPPRQRVSGRANWVLEADGTLSDLAATRVELGIEELVGAFDTLDFGLARPAVLSYGSGDLRIQDLEAAVGRGRLYVSGGLVAAGDDTLTVRLEGDAADLVDLAAAAGPETGAASLPPLGATGDVRVALDATGPLDAVELTGDVRIDDGAISAGDYPPVAGLTLRATVEDDSLRVDTLRAVWASAEIAGSAALPLELGSTWLPDVLARPFAESGRPGRIQARIRRLSANALAGWLDPATARRISGQADAYVELELPAPEIESLRGRVTLPDAEFEVSGIPVTQRRPTEIVIEDGRATLTSFVWGNETSDVTVGGHLRLGDGLATDLSVSADLDLRAAGALVPALAAAGVTTAGSARLTAAVTGPMADPEVRGAVEIAHGEVRIPEPRLAVTDLNGTLRLGGRSLTVSELAGNANGGRVTFGGGWTFGGPTDRSGFTVNGEGLVLDAPSGLRSEADVVLAVTETGNGLSLSGDVNVLRGAYREPITLAGGLLDVLRQSARVMITDMENGRAADVQLDIRVATAEDIVADNNYIEAELGGDLHLGGTLATPAVTGRVTMREGGRVRFGNRVYEIDVGTVDFIDPDDITPELTLSARTRVGSYDITLNVSGNRDELTTSLRSEPPLPESDIVSVLLTGRRLEQATAATAAARTQALGLVSTELLGQAGRGLGLDLRLGTDAPDAQGQIRFDSSLIAADLNPASRLTVGRDLRENVRLVFSRSLRDNDLAWLVGYLPREDIELRAFFGDENERAYEFRHAVTLGDPRRHAADSSSARRAARVSSLEFSGTAGSDEARLREVVSLRAGDRFDFHRWQRDRDQLEAFYFERGFLEARIRALREQRAGSNVIALRYDILRGPETALLVTGYDLPDAVRRELEAIWSHAVFDTFLLEEIAGRVAEHLADRGYLRATVDARLDESGERGAPFAEDDVRTVRGYAGDASKRVVIRIDPGPRTDDRGLVFEGVAADEPELRSLVESADLGSIAWTKPGRFVAAVTAWYRGRGRLRATASVEAPRFDGGTAELPVRVAAGPLFRVGAVEITGAHLRPVAAVRAAAGLETGSIYTEDAVVAARARIGSSYRQAGFTAAHTTARSVVDEATETVAVRFDVIEGPRQMIDAVVVDGAPRTHPGLVARALGINPGTPVDPAAWNRARKRLYDTGVFRSVDIEARALQAASASGSDGTVPVEARVTLEEWPPYRFRYGLRLADEAAALGEATGRVLRVGAAADVSRRNLLGRGLTTGVSSRVDRDRQAVRAFLTVPTLAGRRIETNLFASRRRDVAGPRNRGFVTDVTTFTAEQRIRPRDALTLAYSGNLDLNRTRDQVPDPDFPFDIRLKIARFNGSAVAETRDDIFDATGGFHHSFNLEYGTEIGRTARFLKYLGQHFVYRKVGPVVLAAAARIGLADSFGTELLPTERFFAGGGNTVRGYAQDSLGPIGALGTPLGGNALVILNQEVRLPLWWRFAGVGFVDAGNVFPSVGDISLRDLKAGAGLGIRIDSPVGLVRIDYGLALQHAEGEPRGRLFLSLGQAF